MGVIGKVYNVNVVCLYEEKKREKKNEWNELVDEKGKWEGVVVDVKKKESIYKCFVFLSRCFTLW